METDTYTYKEADTLDVLSDKEGLLLNYTETLVFNVAQDVMCILSLVRLSHFTVRENTEL